MSIYKIVRRKKSESLVVFDKEGKSHIPDFDNVKPSTMTVIIHTNIIADIPNFMTYMPITDWPEINPTSESEETPVDDFSQYIPSGSIVSMICGNHVRGVTFKKRDANSSKYFNTSACIVMIIDHKRVNAKISNRGRIQMTGCPSVEIATQCVKYLYALMIEAEEWTGKTIFAYRIGKEPDNVKKPVPTSTDPPPEGFVSIFCTALVNKSIYLGYNVRRDKLSSFINMNTNFRSVYESTIASTSVNIKIKNEKQYLDCLPRLTITPNGECVNDTENFEEFVKTLPSRLQKAMTTKDAYHTFFVFSTGAVMQSGRGPQMDKVYNDFIGLLASNRRDFEDIRTSKVLNVDWIDSKHAIEM